MISLTATQLIDILSITEQRAVVWQPHLEAALARFDIDSPLRAAHFIAQIGHESGRLRFVREVWTNSLTQQSYEMAGRLGNTEPGDGQRFMGRGPMQLTGRKNYTLFSAYTGIDFVAQPQLLERIDYGALCAGWFWKFGAGQNLGNKALLALAPLGFGAGVDLNAIADLNDIETITLCINGGLNGYADRMELFRRAHNVFMPHEPTDDELKWERQHE